MDADKSSGEKSRRERRKEARLAKNKKKFDSWVQHHLSSKLRKPLLDSKPEFARKLEKDNGLNEKKENTLTVSDTVMEGEFEGPSVAKMPKSRNSKTKFSEYLQMDMGSGNILAEKDLRLERKLAKKLKVKNGKLGGLDDEVNLLLEGIPSVLDSMEGNNRVVKSHDNEASSKRGIQNMSDEEEIESETESISEEIESEIESVSEELAQSSIASIEEEDNANELKLPNDSRKEKRRTRKTKFEEYIDMEKMQRGVLSANEDLELERKLSKKLKVKEGKLRGDDDDINNLFEGIPYVLDSSEDAEGQGVEGNPAKVLDNRYLSNKSRIMKSAQQEQAQSMIATTHEAFENGLDVVVEGVPTTSHALGSKTKYVASHLRSCVQNESEEYAQIHKRVRGLLNRLSESNIESITGEVSTIVQSVGRSVGSQIIVEEVLESCSGGPRGNEQYAATFAAFVAGMACLVGIDFGAKLLASLAKCFEMEYLKEDNLSLRNLTLLLSYLYIFGVCTSDLVYDFMIVLSKRLTEVDVSTILTILQSCGMKLRADDPVGMKNFIQSVQQRVNELKASSENGQSNSSGKRMEFMLETICDIKNNKKRHKEETVQHTRIKKWMQKLRVDDILIRGLKWSKLLDPEKKGQWWLSGDVSTSDKIEKVASKIDREVPEAQKMLQLAAAQRMNTDARRAIFCVIMSADDFRDAFAKLLSLDLHGKQDREIIRVLLECCLQEKVFNKYYTVLAHKLCKHDKNYKFTLQYCLWDHFKELETMPLIRSMNLAKFTAEMVASFSLSLAVLKAVDLSDAVQLSPKRIMHFRMLFEAIFEFPDKLVWNAFSRIAGTSEYESLRTGIKFFISKYVISSRNPLEQKFKIAKKALKNVKGFLM